MARHNALGKWGEDIAADMLAAKGYAICERNWKLKHHEIDIIAMRDNCLVFAEVKTRSNTGEDPLECIDKRKIMHMVRAAEAYIEARDSRLNVQFDLFAVSGTPDDYSVEHIPDAFEPPLKSYR